MKVVNYLFLSLVVFAVPVMVYGQTSMRSEDHLNRLQLINLKVQQLELLQKMSDLPNEEVSFDSTQESLISTRPQSVPTREVSVFSEDEDASLEAKRQLISDLLQQVAVLQTRLAEIRSAEQQNAQPEVQIPVISSVPSSYTETVRAAGRISILSNPSLTAGVVGVVESGQLGTATSDPQIVEGLVWREVSFAGVTGWTVENVLEL